MKRAIYENDLKLLKICEVTKDYPILLDIMENNPEICIEELSSISEEHVRFFKNTYPRIREQAFKEWTGSVKNDVKYNSDKDKKVFCYICDRPLKIICTIRNIFTGQEINIGKDCNKHFGIYKEKELEEALESKRKIIRLDKLDKEFPGLIDIIKNWRNIINNENLYIFKFIKEKYLEIGEKLSELHKEYTEDKKISITRENEILKDINLLLSEGEKEKRKIEEFIKDKKEEILYPTQKMVNSMIKNSDYEGLERLEKDRKITWRTLHRFTDEQFCKNLIIPFNRYLKEKEISVEKFKRYKKDIGYYLKINKNKECKVFYKYEDLCFLCGGEITNESEKTENFTYKEIVKDSILVDEYSIEFGLSKIEYIIADKGIELEQYFHEFEDVIWKFKKENSNKVKCYYKTKISNIQNILKDLLYDINEYNENKLFNLLIKNSSRLQNGEAYDLIKRRN
ncbi:hypothetical protein [Clostridium baratii]|uniref:hypothetical protein n=1 Tax=Clostridium baratii TaxID=1561 RepID=UPI0022DEC696|nr:hypothetical protein [Clostridium baratii]